MKIKDLIKIQEVVSKRATPIDILDETSVYHSAGRGIDIPILEMDLTHVVRAFKKLIHSGESDFPYYNIKGNKNA